MTRNIAIFIRTIYRKKGNRDYLRKTFSALFGYCLLVYILFNALWGLNYNRRGIAYQMGLTTAAYSKAELIEVADLLTLKLNSLQAGSLASRRALTTKKYLFSGAMDAYDTLSVKDPIFGYSFPSVKPSLYSYLGNYLGFTGYYNPFTGEAQVNTTIPGFARPFTACHEIGHQLGYAKESEANFSGFLAARSSRDTAFLYSTYFDLYSYAGKYLYLADSAELKRLNRQLSPGVRKDMTDLRAFFRKYSTPVETIIDDLYARFLMANQQPSGKMSYSEVIGLLIAYYHKYGTI